MAIRQRATRVEDKQERREAILDAATQLLLRSPERFASMADVADEAGLAKGTVYLYFSSKVDLLLAVHERSIDGFFTAFQERLASDAPVAIDDVLGLIHGHVVVPALVLPLAARCLSLLGQRARSATVAAFEQRMMDRLAAAAAGIEKHFPQLGPGDGMVLLRQTCALTLGLWQMSGASENWRLPRGNRGAAGSTLHDGSFAADLDRALLTLWNGATGQRTPT